MTCSVKFCRSCQQDVPCSDFTPSKRAKDGLQSYCRSCYAKRAVAHRLAFPDAAREAGRRSLEKNRDVINARKRARRAANPEKTKAERKASYAKRRDRELEAMRKWKDANRERMRAAQFAKYWEDPEASRKKQMDYLHAHPGRSAAAVMKRIARKHIATVPWANLGAITAMYRDAALRTRSTGTPHEVDHIIPLQSKWVCGLHCEANLQVITRSENRSKSNHFRPGLIAQRG